MPTTMFECLKNNQVIRVARFIQEILTRSQHIVCRPSLEHSHTVTRECVYHIPLPLTIER